MLIFIFLSIVCATKDPYLRCCHNPLLRSNSLVAYQILLDRYTSKAAHALISNEIMHCGFKLSNPDAGRCANIINATNSCCNSSTVKKLDQLVDYHDHNSNFIKLPILQKINQIGNILFEPNSSRIGCLTRMKNYKELMIVGVSKNGTFTPTIADITNITVANTYKIHDQLIHKILEIQKSLVKSYTCLLCMATTDFSKYSLKNGSLLMDPAFYNSTANDLSNTLVNLTKTHDIFVDWFNNSMNKFINKSCSDLYSIFDSGVNLRPCTTPSSCFQFVTTYMGGFMFPKVLWKLMLIGKNKSEPLINTIAPIVFSATGLRQ